DVKRILDVGEHVAAAGAAAVAVACAEKRAHLQQASTDSVIELAPVGRGGPTGLARTHAPQRRGGGVGRQRWRESQQGKCGGGFQQLSAMHGLCLPAAHRARRRGQPTAFTAWISSAATFCASPYNMRVLSR